MSTPKKVMVWALTTGSYSDYRVQAVFATEAQARRAADMRGSGYDSGNDPEAMWLYPEGATDPKQIRVYYHNVELWDDGREDDVREHSELQWEYDPWDSRYMKPRPFVRFVRAPCHKNKGGRLEVHGTSQSACRKAVSDYIAQWKAQGHRLNEMNA